MPQEITYFDANASFGAPAAGLRRPCLTAEELLAEMDWAGVECALVRHVLMREQSPVVGNAVLTEALAAAAAGERLVGSWAILPPQTRELPAAPAFFQAMAAAKVRALWAYPDDHRYLLGRTTFSGFLDEVAVRRIPLFVPRTVGWPVVYQLLEEYPTLTLVVAGHGPWGEDRYFRPLLERYPRFHVDVSRYELDGGIAELVALYGAERLLYGSGFPEVPMGGARLMVGQAPIDDDARAAIAGGNLRRLLAEEDLS